MLQTILHYLILGFITGLFSMIYFKLLKSSMDKVLSKQKSVSHIYSSFLLRISLAALFFFLILKYYKEVEEIVLVVLTLMFFKYLATKEDRRNIKNSRKDIL